MAGRLTSLPEPEIYSVVGNICLGLYSVCVPISGRLAVDWKAFRNQVSRYWRLPNLPLGATQWSHGLFRFTVESSADSEQTGEADQHLKHLRGLGHRSGIRPRHKKKGIWGFKSDSELWPSSPSAGSLLISVHNRWWLNGAAACRDGIVNNPYYHITADEDVAYAVAMTQMMESNCSKYESCSYTAQAGDLGIFKLMATINGEQRKVIRVLRSWKLHSPLAPSAGLRYDGLYRVMGYGVKSSYEMETKSYNWRYTFHLKREPGQEGMQKSLAVPNADQLDDWQDYIGGPTYSPEEMLVEEIDEGMGQLDEKTTSRAEERHDSIDSGYFSPDPASSKR